jgi:MFS family permease
MMVTARTLAVHAYERDDRVSEHVFRVIFQGFGAASIVVAAFAGVSAWALWRGKRWAWWVLVVLTALGSLAALRPRSVWGAITVVPVVVALVALLLPTSRSYVRRTRMARETAPDEAEPWSGQPAAYASEDQWLQGR